MIRERVPREGAVPAQCVLGVFQLAKGRMGALPAAVVDQAGLEGQAVADLVRMVRRLERRVRWMSWACLALAVVVGACGVVSMNWGRGL
jgi:hypothetical protein